MTTSQQFGSRCINGWRYFDVSVNVENWGEKLATGFSVIVKLQVPTAAPMPRDIGYTTVVTGGYLAPYSSIRYVSPIMVKCEDVPADSRASVTAIIDPSNTVIECDENANKQTTVWVKLR